MYMILGLKENFAYSNIVNYTIILGNIELKSIKNIEKMEVKR